MHAGHAAFDGIGRAAGFGDHAAGDGAIGNEFLGLFDRQAGQQRSLFVQYARYIGLEKNASQVNLLVGLANLYLLRRQLMAA
jgi:hypothetical protein